MGSPGKEGHTSNIQKAFRKSTTCWENHISTKLKDCKVNHSNVEKESNP